MSVFTFSSHLTSALGGGAGVVLRRGIVEVVGDKFQLLLQHQLKIRHGVDHVSGRVVDLQQLAQVKLLHAEGRLHLLGLGTEDMAQRRLLQSDALHQVDDCLIEGNARQGGTIAGNTVGAVGGISHKKDLPFSHRDRAQSILCAAPLGCHSGFAAFCTFSMVSR